ncbi:MAG: aminotransferase class III-fold pyridoxal phosphate-dependent enzyme, partial [Myxococcota bacterium]
TEQQAARPVALSGGDGAHFTTADGRRWLDLGSFSYQANLGHGHSAVIAAIKRQADELCMAMPEAVFPAKTELARRLLDLAPAGFSRVFFALGGAEAVENALKIARMVTGRHKMIARYRSYHGSTMGALSLSGDWRRPPLEPGVPGVLRALDCYCERCPFGHQLATCARECATHIDHMLALEGGTVGAVILEPVVGANGVLIPPAEYWPQVRRACDRHDALLIADEVLTGFGRTGRCFAFEHWGAVPDMIVLGKALTGGYAPLSAVLVNDRIAEHFAERVLACGLTNYAHPLGCAAGVATLEAYREENLFARSEMLGPVLLSELETLRLAHPTHIRHVRGIGLLAAIELEAEEAVWRSVAAGLARRAVATHVYPGRGMIIVAPPLCIDESDLRRGLRVIAEEIARAVKETA